MAKRKNVWGPVELCEFGVAWATLTPLVRSNITLICLGRGLPTMPAADIAAAIVALDCGPIAIELDAFLEKHAPELRPKRLTGGRERARAHASPQTRDTTTTTEEKD